MRPRFARCAFLLCLVLVLCPIARSWSGESANYPGYAPNAPWRSAAAERIERFRKGEHRLRLVSPDGAPLAGVEVSCRLLRHDFGFGTAVSASALCAQGPDYDQYRATIQSNFNGVVFENDLKWPQWEANHGRVLGALQWIEENKLKVRGHVLVWPSWKNLPNRLLRYRLDLPLLRRAVRNHIRDEVRTLSGRVLEWDVLNETYRSRDLLRLLGRDAMVEWFQTAHESDPSARLFYNEEGMFATERNSAATESFYNTARFLIRNQAPLNGLGEQAHFRGHPPSIETILRRLDRFRQLGLPIEITEFDFDTTDRELQAAFTRDFLTAVFSHPAVEGVMLWGFWEKHHWRPDAALWQRDWTLKPNGRAYLDLIHREWTTEAVLTTDAHGSARFRGYFGQYEIAVKGGSTHQVHFGREQTPVDLVLDRTRK